jgi:hypothetical protein
MKAAVLRIIGVLGVLGFGTLFAFTFSTPTWVEDFAVQYIESQVRERLEERIDGLELPQGDGELAKSGAALFEAARGMVEKRREQLKEQIHARMAAALAEIRRSDCECRTRAELLDAGAKLESWLVDLTTRRFDDFIQSTYMDVVNDLKRDLRIFTASNFLVFLLLLIASFTRRELADWLFVPGLLLGASAAFCTYCYLLNQNWLLTVVQVDYVGFAYLFGLFVIFLFLLDVVLNRARVTINLLHHAFGLKPPFEC